MNENYETRKNAEVRLMQNFLVEHKTNDKNELINKIKAKIAINTNISLSKSKEDTFYFGKNRLDYTYLRFDNKYEINNVDKLTRISTINNCYIKTLFFNSGMSAISTVITAVNDTSQFEWIYKNNIYFETFKEISNLSKKKHRKMVYYFDSISPDFCAENIIAYKSIRNNDIVIIDSTCITNNNLNRLIENFICKDILLLIVKSLTKLDMLATEYSRLGCLTIALPNFLDEKLKKIYVKIMSKIISTSINFNCSPHPCDFFPLWDNDDFFKINETRINQIKLNTSNVYKYLISLKKCNISVILPNHTLFILIFPNKIYSRDELIIKCKKISDALKNKYDIRYCGSFGFDFISLDTYIDVATNKQTIRLSLNDYDKVLTNCFAKDFGEVLYDNI